MPFFIFIVSTFKPNISPSEAKFKNNLDDPELVASQLKGLLSTIGTTHLIIGDTSLLISYLFE